ncbi:MAG: hypothetical protein Kow0068_13980 [Marinilabiliales bacterium]
MFNLSCRGEQDNLKKYDKNDIKNMLLYVEDIDGKGGLGDFYFGDIILLDLNSKQKYIVDKNKYYDVHPNYVPDRHSIIFESKREKGKYLTGLSQRSTLYEFDLIRKETKNLIIPPLRDPSHSFKGPAYSEKTGNLAFMKIEGWRKTIIFTYNFQTKKTNNLDTLSHTPDSFMWSSDGNYLICFFSIINFRNISKSKKFIVIYDVNKRKKYVYNLKKENIFKLITLAFMENNNLYAFTKDDDKSSTLIRVTVSDEELQVMEIKKFFGLYEIPYGVKIADGTIAFIGSIYENKILEDDIYIYDIKSDKLERLTHDGHSKGYLKYIR